jgi:hypothetical protein
MKQLISPAFLQLVPAFILGCILTEIRWIVRMRQLRTPLGRCEPGNELAEVFDSGESLRNLAQQLAAEPRHIPSREPSVVHES